MLQTDDIAAIGSYGKEVIGYLIRALEEPNMRLRANAVEALGETEDPAAIPVLVNYPPTSR